MLKTIFPLASIVLVVYFSSAIVAAPGAMQPGQPAKPTAGSIPQLQLTPDYLYQQITSLKQQVTTLQGQVSALRSIVQVTQNGATIQAENLTLKGIKNLAMTSLKTVQLTAANNLALTSGKTLSLKGGNDVNAEGAGKINLKAPQIKFNDGNKPIALKDSPVSRGKVISGSTTVFAK